MRAKLIVFPNEDGFNVAVWGAWTEGSIQVRSFDNRTTMIGPREAQELEEFTFLSSCPLYSAEIDEETLEAHGVRRG